MEYSKRVIVHGNGGMPSRGDEIVVSYRMYRYDESKVDNKGDLLWYDPKFKANIGQGKLIEGLEKALLEMTIGEVAVVTLPSQLVYGINSKKVYVRFFDGTPPDELPLIFDLQLVSIGTTAQEPQEG